MRYPRNISARNLGFLVSAKVRKPGLYDVEPPLDAGTTYGTEGPTVSDNTLDDASWEGFKPDAARAIRATQGFETAAADLLDRPFDPATQGGVLAAVKELAEATPAAMRVAQMQLGGVA